MLAHSFFIESSSKLLVTRTGIKAWSSLILDQIRPLILELLALEWRKFHTFELEYLKKPVGQSWSNFMYSIIRVGERLHKVLGQIDLDTLDSGEGSLLFGLLVLIGEYPAPPTHPTPGVLRYHSLNPAGEITYIFIISLPSASYDILLKKAWTSYWNFMFSLFFVCSCIYMPWTEESQLEQRILL